MIISVLLNSTSLQCAVISTDPECYVMTLTLTIHICKDQARTSVIIWQWLFRRRRQFALGIYFAVIIHVCLYSQICYYRTSDSVV